MKCDRTKVSQFLDLLDFEEDDFQENPTMNHVWNSIQIIRWMWKSGQDDFVRIHLRLLLDFVLGYYEGEELIEQAEELKREYFSHEDE